MAKNTSGKIFVWAKVLCVLCIIALSLAGVFLVVGILALLTSDLLGALIPFVICEGLLFSALGFYLSNVLLSGYGEMINNSHKLAAKADIIIDRLTELCDAEKEEEKLVLCQACKTLQNAENKFCYRCGNSLRNG